MMSTQFSEVVRTVIMMSLSGAALALILLAVKPMIRHRLPKSVQYGLWLVALFALLIPVSKLIVLPEVTKSVALAPIHAAVERNVVAAEEGVKRLLSARTMEVAVAAVPQANVATPNAPWTATTVFIGIYLSVAFLVLSYYLISYAHFTRKIRKNRTKVGKDELYACVGLCGDANPPRLYLSSIATTPMLIGVFKPEIILPDREYTGAELQSIMLHELVHLRRRDIAFKWLSTLACAIHWINPIAWLIRREINHTCELSCDEAVIRDLDSGGRRNYGDTLISIAAGAGSQRVFLSTTMCEGKGALKDRLNAIMKWQRHTRATRLLSVTAVALAICLICALGAGAKTPAALADTSTPTPSSEPAKEGAKQSQRIIAADQPVKVSPDHLKLLRENAVEVRTEKEFLDALETAYVIVVKKDVVLEDVFFPLRYINALLIDEGVTLTVTSPNFYVECEIVNLGEIVVEDSGRMVFYQDPNYSRIGKVSIDGRDAEVSFFAGVIGADEIAYYLAEDSLFNTLTIVAGAAEDELAEIIVDHDITIPAGKALEFNIESVLRVPKGVTLTNNGAIWGYNKAIIEGKVEGIGKIMMR